MNAAAVYSGNIIYESELIRDAAFPISRDAELISRRTIVSGVWIISTNASLMYLTMPECPQEQMHLSKHAIYGIISGI